METSMSTSRFRYEVFLTFRGKDTGRNFTDHLYSALVQAGFHTFRDRDEIQRAENIGSEISKAIHDSRLSLVVFSRNYAASRWCLDELVMILERRKTGGQIVLPIFYDVEPSEVREQKGSCGDAFVMHLKEGFKEEILKKWKTALVELANLGGMVFRDQYESEFIKEIVDEVAKNMRRAPVTVAPNLVGVDSSVEPINLWLRDGSNNVGIAAIYGMGGIGKTTISKIVYNLNFTNFEGSSYLSSVREKLEKPNGLVRLQRQMISDLSSRKADKICSEDDGNNRIKGVIRSKKVLLVFDDVDKMDQVSEVIRMREWFKPGSKILITTRDAHLPRSLHVNAIFKIRELDFRKSLQLFSWHAFGQNSPVNSYYKLSESLVRHCGGLPLALEVLGSSLYGKSIDAWGSALQKLGRIFPGEVQKILRISYDSLDDHDKHLFLDIAFFFIGLDINFAVRILDGCNFYTACGIQNLIDRCLVTANEENKLVMHQLVRDMGREIVRQESPQDPGMRSRLWDNTDTLSVLTESNGTASIRSLALNMEMVMEYKSSRVVGSASRSFSTKALTKMQKLKFLHFNSVKLNGSYKDLPRSLVWLRWQGFPLNSIPVDFCLEKLIVLEMHHSNLKCVWKGIKFLAELKVLDLSHSHRLVRTPTFTGLPALEELVLKDCTKLAEVDESIGELERLVLLNLEDCKNLKKLPMRISMLKSLKELVISGCLNLGQLPKKVEQLVPSSLPYAGGSASREVDTNTKNLKQNGFPFLHSNFWSWLSPRLCTQSASFSLAMLPYSLARLDLADCNISDNAIPKDLTCLPTLNKLNLSGNPIHCLPESLNKLTMLQELELRRCRELKSLVQLPTSLVHLIVDECPLLERIGSLPQPYFLYWWEYTLRDVPTWLKRMGYQYPIFSKYGCGKLVEVQHVFKLQPLRETSSKILCDMGVFNLESLQRIEVQMFNPWSLRKWWTTIQELHEHGIRSIFVPGTGVPDWFSHRKKGSKISFHVPQVIGDKSFALSLCIVYGSTDIKFSPASEICVRVYNQTKDLVCSYIPTFFAVPNAEQDMSWVSHWCVGSRIECGDEVYISVDSLYSFNVKECGIRLIQELEEKGNQPQSEEVLQSTSPWDRMQVRDPDRWMYNNCCCLSSVTTPVGKQLGSGDCKLNDIGLVIRKFTNRG